MEGVVVVMVEDTGEDLVEVDFMAEVLEDILLDSLVDAVLVVDGTEEAVTGEDVAITRTEDTPIPTSVFVGILNTIRTMLTDIGLRSVILMAGATGSGCRIIEGEGYFLLVAILVLSKNFHLSVGNQRDEDDKRLAVNRRKTKDPVCSFIYTSGLCSYCFL